jgi:membrane protease YdiL (CAAX protease family)
MEIQASFNQMKAYATPIVQKVAKCTLNIGKESVTVVATAIFISMMTQRLLVPLAPSRSNFIRTTVVSAPVLEEIVFRVGLHEGIHLMQSFKNRFISKHPPSSQELQNQKIFRIWVGALIFGAAHLSNGHKTFTSALTQFSLSTAGGLVYGSLKEKYNTIAVGILAHSLNNGLACLAMITVNKPGMEMVTATSLCGVFAMKFFWYVLGTTNYIEDGCQKAANQVKWTFNHIKDQISPPFLKVVG